MFVYQTDVNSEVKLVLEYSGDNVEYKWLSVELPSLMTKTHNWERIRYKFNLGDNFNKSNIVKVYLLNNSRKTDVYIDDIYIRFE